MSPGAQLPPQWMTAPGVFSPISYQERSNAPCSRSGTLGKTRIPVIRPFMEIPAPEVIRYAELHPSVPVVAPCCRPCAGSGSRSADARAALDTYDCRHPATKFALANLDGTLGRDRCRTRAAPVMPGVWRTDQPAGNVKPAASAGTLNGEPYHEITEKCRLADHPYVRRRCGS